jgi:hypothetical protein
MKLSIRIYRYMLFAVTLCLYAVHGNASNDINVMISMKAKHIEYQRAGGASLVNVVNELVSDQYYCTEILGLIFGKNSENKADYTVFRFDDDIAQRVKFVINSLQEKSTNIIKNYLQKNRIIPSNADVSSVKSALEKAVNEFKGIIDKMIFGEDGFPSLGVSHSDELLNNWQMYIKGYPLIQAHGDRERAFNFLDSLFEYRKSFHIPLIRLSNNHSDLAKPWRAIYRAIEKLGKTLGFYCQPLDSWGGWISRYKVPLLMATGIGMAGLAYVYMKYQMQVPGISAPLGALGSVPTSDVLTPASTGAPWWLYSKSITHSGLEYK